MNVKLKRVHQRHEQTMNLIKFYWMGQAPWPVEPIECCGIPITCWNSQIFLNHFRRADFRLDKIDFERLRLALLVNDIV